MGCLHTSRWFLLFLQAFTPCWTMQSIVQYDYEQRPFLNTKYNFSYTRGVPRHTKEIAKRYFFRMPLYGKAGALRRQPSQRSYFHTSKAGALRRQPSQRSYFHTSKAGALRRQPSQRSYFHTSQAGAESRQPSTSTNRNQVITDTLSPCHFRQSSPRTYP